MTGRALPPNASVADALGDGRLSAPAAERNRPAITALLKHHAPSAGNALEIASGTGQHVVAFARQMPDLRWHPTEPDPARLSSIEAYRREANLQNIAMPARLDATQVAWSDTHGSFDLIVLINLLHLITSKQTTTLIREASLALNPSGRLVLYGPFKRNGKLTSEGDARFDAELRSADPSIGYKDDLDIRRTLKDTGLNLKTIEAMPANNLAFIAQKP